MLTGTHGDGGVSGLTESNSLDRGFYEADCKRKNSKVCFEVLFSKTLGVGVVPQTKSEEIPDIMEIQKAELSEDTDCFYNDPDINQMRIQVGSLRARSDILT